MKTIQQQIMERIQALENGQPNNNGFRIEDMIDTGSSSNVSYDQRENKCEKVSDYRKQGEYGAKKFIKP